MAPKRRRYDSSDSEEDLPGRVKTPEDEKDAPSSTVYRDALGRRVAVGDLKDDVAEKQRKREEKQKRDYEWAMGTTQRSLYLDRLEEGSRPMSRFKDDEELNDALKSRERWGDPALAGGFTTQKVKGRDSKLKRPQYTGPWPPNRYDIKPGFRWDGVDRSNGFENKLLLSQNERLANKQTAYKWSSEDM